MRRRYKPSPTMSPVSDTPGTQIDLDRIESDLAGVESALERLEAGTYWTDEVTGADIPAETLANDPVARRAPQH